MTAPHVPLVTAPHVPLVTERLLMRPFVVSDVPDVAAYRGSASVCRYLEHEPMDEAGVAAFIEDRLPATGSGSGSAAIGAHLGVELDGRVIGDVSLRCGSEISRQVEIGWVFNPDFGGRGYATEAAGAMVDLAFAEWGRHRIWAQLDPRNERSAALCERLGMRREAHLREESWFKGEWGDLLIYATLAPEWAARRR